jgi:hypothetical protein
MYLQFDIENFIVLNPLIKYWEVSLLQCGAVSPQFSTATSTTMGLKAGWQFPVALGAVRLRLAALLLL